MKTIVRNTPISKPVGVQSNILYTTHDFTVGEEVEVVSRDGEVLNVAKVIASEKNNIVLEMIA